MCAVRIYLKEKVNFRCSPLFSFRFLPISGFICGHSSSGRAPPCQGGGSEFESRWPLQRLKLPSLLHAAPAPHIRYSGNFFLTRTKSRILFGIRRLSPFSSFPVLPSPVPPFPQIKAQRSGFDLDKELQSEGRKKRPQGSLGDMSFDSDVWRHSQVVRHGTANP